MGLDISQIKNSKLQNLAYAKDVDKNGNLDESEFSIFKTEAQDLKGVSKRALKKAMGLYISDPATNNGNNATAIFNKYVDAAKKENLALDYDKILKDVKEELKEQDIYDKKEFKALEKYVKEQEQENANEEVWLKIQEHSDETSGRKLRKNVKEEFKTEYGELNKYQKKALKHSKEYSKDKARANNVEKHTYQTEEEILKQIDKDVFDRLIKNGLIEKAPDDSENAGKYDISQLQTIIARQIGPDNTMNTGLNNFESERRTLRSQLSIDLGYNNEGDKIDKGDRNDLVRLSGMKVQHGFWKVTGELAKNTLIGSAIGAATGIAGNALKPTQYDIDPNVHVEQATKVVVDVKQNVDVELPDGAILIENGTKVLINAKQIVDIPGGVYALSKLTGWDAAIGAVSGGLVGLLGSIPTAITKLAEKTVASNNFKECDFDKYVEFEKVNNPKYAPILEKLAGAFYDKENNVWHHDKYREFLNLASGDRSGLNRQEIIGALRTTYEAKEKGKVIVNDCGEVILGPDKKPEPPKPTPTPVTPTREKVQVEEKCDEFKGEIINGNKYLWQEITKGYECLSEYKPATAIRILKVIQAINDNNYDLTRLAHIAELTFKAGKGNAEALQELKTMPGFDYNTFLVWKGGTGTVKLPSSLGDNCELNRSAIVHNGRFGKGGKYTTNANHSKDCDDCYYEYDGKKYAQTAEGKAKLQQAVGNKDIEIVKR